MNTERIKHIILSKTTLKAAVIHIGMTEGGFYTSIKNNTIKVSTLEKLADFLQIDIKNFFTEMDIKEIKNEVREEQEVYQVRGTNKNISQQEKSFSQLINILEMKEKKEIDLIEIIKNQSIKHK